MGLRSSDECGLPSNDEYLALMRENQALKEKLTKVVEVVEKFGTVVGDWEWCQCSECKIDCRSHAINEDKSMEKLRERVKQAAT